MFQPKSGLHWPSLLAVFLLFLSIGVTLMSFKAHSETEIDFSKAEWRKHSDDDGINVYIWEVPGSPVFAFKAEARIEATVPRVANVIIDMTRQKEWNPDVGEARTLRQISPTERLEYWVIETPFVIKDRDFVLDTRADFEAKTNTLFLRFKSVEDPAMPPTSKVRGLIHASHYALTPTEDGKATQATYLVHVDPMGSCPKWIINMFQKSYPHETLMAIRKQVAKASVLEHAQVKALFTSKTFTGTLLDK